MLIATLTALSAACTKKPSLERVTFADPPATVPAPPPPPLQATTPSAPDRALSEDEIFARKSLEELNAERPLGDVFFALDDTAITEEGRLTLQRNAEWLHRWTSIRTVIEGHCDERGTSEYNLALGDRRANAVREYLVSLGIDGERLWVVSKGKESPVCADQHEDCWRRNRRAQSIITAK